MIIGVWTAPGAPESIPKGGALRAPPIGIVSGASGAAKPKLRIDIVMKTFSSGTQKPSKFAADLGRHRGNLHI